MTTKTNTTLFSDNQDHQGPLQRRGGFDHAERAGWDVSPVHGWDVMWAQGQCDEEEMESETPFDWMILRNVAGKGGQYI